jgi:hypothetical protein
MTPIIAAVFERLFYTPFDAAPIRHCLCRIFISFLSPLFHAAIFRFELMPPLPPLSC